MPTGLSPEVAVFNMRPDGTHDIDTQVSCGSCLLAVTVCNVAIFFFSFPVGEQVRSIFSGALAPAPPFGDEKNCTTFLM